MIFFMGCMFDCIKTYEGVLFGLPPFGLYSFGLEGLLDFWTVDCGLWTVDYWDIWTTGHFDWSHLDTPARILELLWC